MEETPTNEETLFCTDHLALLASMLLAACGRGGADEPTAAPSQQPLRRVEPTSAPAVELTAACRAAEHDGAGGNRRRHDLGRRSEGAASVGLTCLADAHGSDAGHVVT
ncbi:MAG: hypothetical protein M9927_04980 [Anaerolineae bacterium]|nr:hypothetical protein [Anaerolineae bacterium]